MKRLPIHLLLVSVSALFAWVLTAALRETSALPETRGMIAGVAGMRLLDVLENLVFPET